MFDRLLLFIKIVYFNPRTCTRCDTECQFDLFPCVNFNPRTCTRCDDTSGVKDAVKDEFQSTHLHEVRCLPANSINVCSDISIHAPARGAMMAEPSYRLPLGFQSTHLHEVRFDNPFISKQFIEISIHAPARGAIFPDVVVRHPGIISIHAPARGAMMDREQQVTAINISIHAPARGAIRRIQKYKQAKTFQSTHLHEVR